MRKQLAAIFVIVGFAFICFPRSAMADEQASIQELLETAEPGESIQLENHVYHEDVVIDKPVTIKGAENTVIHGTGEGNVVTLNHDGITLENVTVKNSGSILDYDYAGIKIYSDHNKVMNTRIEDSLHGIYLSENTGNKLIGNTITGNQQLTQSSRGNGIHLFHSSDNVIRNNTIDEARDGVYFSFSHDNQVNQNRMTNHRYGLHYMYSDDNTFHQNEFFENTGGAAIMYSDNITLTGNQFYDHHNLQSFGILLQTANDATIENNQIHFNQKGIFMDQSNRNFFKGNVITNNQIGLDVWNSAINNQFTGNHILENNLQYTTNGGEDANEWSVQGTGNAWSDHNVIDLDEDGTADNAYVHTSAFGEVLSEQPLGVLFLHSPALTIYEKWNELIGQEKGTIQDPNPIHVQRETASIASFGLWIMVLAAGIFGVIYWRKRRHQERG